jgi:L-lysine 2,3-aminomutase
MSSPPWSTLLNDMTVHPDALADQLNLPKTAWQDMLGPHKDFPLRVPKRWINKITPGDLHHPLLKQVLPSAQEKIITPGYNTDPLAEQQANPTPGLLHKYHGRVLMIAAPSCAIHCRYCFRRHFDYHGNQTSQAQWQAIFDYIQSDTSIHEVILSGGDPLMLKNHVLTSLMQQLDAIPHITTIRIHTRMPVVLPERIDTTLLTMLETLQAQIAMVIHTNHALELDDDVQKALLTLKNAGTTNLNQSVLLQGVNDDPETLIALSHRLWQCQVLPYYLHLPDKVQGTAHFDVTENKAKTLMQQLSQQLPGYLVPKLAREIPGHGAKHTVA